MRAEFEFDCVYGSGHTRDTGYYYNGWYVVHNSTNVNYTYEEIDSDGLTDVENLYDVDSFTAAKPICSLAELIIAVDDDEDGEEE